MILQENYVLHNGVPIPKLALGTWQVSNEDAVNSVKTALSLGYRHIDTAAAYQNEQGVGRALRESGIERASVFLTTKNSRGSQVLCGSRGGDRSVPVQSRHRLYRPDADPFSQALAGAVQWQ